MKKMMNLVFCSASLLASPCKQNPGITICENGETDSINQVGLVRMNGFKVNGPTQVSGSLQAKGCKFKKLKIKGNAQLSKSEIQEHSQFYGLVKTDMCTFSQMISIHSENTVLSGTKTQDIEIYSSSPAKITISNSQINGDITFKGSKGQVICDGCQIHGKVNNGTLGE